MSKIRFYDDEGVEVAIAYCPLCSKHFEKADVRNGDRKSAANAVKIKLKLHIARCTENPDREKDEMDELIDRIWDKE